MIINFWEGLGYSFFSIFMYELFMMAIREIKKGVQLSQER